MNEMAGRLLPNEPCGRHAPQQRVLTERHLLPALAELEAYFLAVRMQIDPGLRQAQPVKLAKPYPLGQCLEITLAVQQRLRSLDGTVLDGAPARGQTAFREFLRAGGSLRQVWGDLRGEFFQNAFQLGTLYVDVANDTVTPTKPKVEILPFAEARLVPIADYRHFSRLAVRYWQDRVFPNHVLPELAPYCPLIHVTPAGQIRVGELTGYMLAMTQAQGFEPSAEVLRDAAMPDALFAVVRRGLADAGFKLAATAEEGRAWALRACREFRAKRWHTSQRQTGQAVVAVRRANRLLAKATQAHPFSSEPTAPVQTTSPESNTMSNPQTIRIDGTEYRLSELSAEARQQLEMLIATESRLKELQRDLAITQTAHAAYAKALRAVLPAQEPAALRSVS